MKKTAHIFLLAVMLIAFAQNIPSAPSPTFNRLSGLIDIPTADIAGDGTIAIGLHLVPESEDEDANLYLGVAERAELGLTFFNPDKIVGNAKFLLSKEEERGLGVAIGVENIGRKIANLYGKEHEGEEYSLYAVMSKSLATNGLRGHLGIGTRRFVGHGPISEDLHGLFIGIEKEFSIGERESLTMMVEADGRDVNAGLKYSIPEGLRIELAVTEIDNLLEEHQDAGLDVAYCLGATWLISPEEMRPPRKRPVIPIRERAALLEEEIVKRGVIKQGLKRYLTSENIRVSIIQREKMPNYVRLYVRIENTGEDPIYANPNYFTLVNEEGARFYYSVETFSYKRPFLGGRLWPGREMEGTLVFMATGVPRELIYGDGWRNLVSQKIR